MIPEMEEEYPLGSDLTIMNTYYNFPVYNDGKKIHDDFICLIYKDNKTGRKRFKIIEKPKYTYYLLKDEYMEGNDQGQLYNKLFIEKEKVDMKEVPFTNLEKSIAADTGNMDFYKANIMEHRKGENKKLHTNPRVFFSDSNIEDHYRFKFSNTYTNNINKITKGYFDIEVDGKFAAGDFVQMGECEINCVTFHDDNTNTSFTFILRNQHNPLIQQFEDEILSGKFTEDNIKDFVVKSIGSVKRAKKFSMFDTRYKLFFFDHEIELLKALFATMHRCSPDFILGWNSSSFDLNYIINRIIVLGYDPADIMCDKNWPIKVVKNYIDEKNKNDLAERGDYTFISGLPVFMDQMIQYASRRKSKIGSFKSFKLDDIGLKEAKVRKLDYHHITKSVTELPWLDFKTFVLYNIMDVTVQKCIETKTQDIEYIFSKCIVNNTIYRKGHRQTVYLINRMASDWYKMGYIIGNNCNKDNEKPPKFLGALVGNPLNTNDYSKIKINGRTVWICDNLQDYDYKGLYPSIMIDFNIAPNTQLGRLVIPEKVYNNENTYNLPPHQYSRAGEFMENLVTDNFIEFCSRWFGLATVKEFISDIDEYFVASSFDRYSNLSSVFNSPIIPTVNSGIERPVYFSGRKIESPVTFNRKIPGEVKDKFIN